jgi:hypothetical protein
MGYKENEKRFTYPPIKINFIPDGENEEYYKLYSLSVLRQRTIEWMISIQVTYLFLIFFKNKFVYVII